MKYYQILAPMGIFSFNEAVNLINSEENTKKYLSNMIKKGQVRRIKKNLYSIIDPVTNDDSMNRFVIASHISDNSFICLHTAFEFYGLYNQNYYDVQVMSHKRFTEFNYGDYRYRCFLSNNSIQVDSIQGVKVTSIERTIVDSINLLGKSMDIEELVKCIELIHHVNEKKIEEMLEYYDKDLLYRKVGYVLSYFKKELNLSDDFFNFCKGKSNELNYGYLSHSEIKKLKFIKEWGIYA